MVRAPQIRPGVGWLAGTLGVVLVVVALLPFRDSVSHTVPTLLLVLPCVIAGFVGGRLTAVVVAAEAAAALASAFLAPFGSLRVAAGEDLLALLVFVAVGTLQGAAAGAFVRAERRLAVADQARIRTLEEANADRRALLYGLSHDLRTPLATIRGVASDLSGPDAVIYDAPTRQRLLAMVDQEAARLNRIIDNVLTLSQVESGSSAVTLEPVDPAAVIEAALRRLDKRERGVHLSFVRPDEVPLVRADPVRLDQVVNNLVENALRYAPTDSEVTVRLEPEAEHVTVSITDTGIGLSEDARRDLFEPFRPGGESSSTGLGLAVARSIVTGHGGVIWLEEEELPVRRSGAGTTTFSFTIPLQR